MTTETDYLGGLIRKTLSHVLQYESSQNLAQIPVETKKNSLSRKPGKKSLSPQEVDDLIEISQKIKDQLENEAA